MNLIKLYFMFCHLVKEQNYQTVYIRCLEQLIPIFSVINFEK